MKKKYVVIDIEASGLTPGKYSMLSVGACILGNSEINFYREIKPISDNYKEESLKIGSEGLYALDKLRHMPEYDLNSDQFNGELVLKKLEEECEEPKAVMKDFEKWILKNTAGYRPIEAAAPIKFDGMFIAWYFDNFNNGILPFGHSGEDINSFLRGVNLDLYFPASKFKGNRKERPHNALSDAIYQAERFEKILKHKSINY